MPGWVRMAPISTRLPTPARSRGGPVAGGRLRDSGGGGVSDETLNDRVGYRRPPKASQFKKGQTGNPGGRPKKRGTSDFDLDKLLDRPMTVKIDGQPRIMQATEVDCGSFWTGR